MPPKRASTGTPSGNQRTILGFFRPKDTNALSSPSQQPGSDPVSAKLSIGLKKTSAAAPSSLTPQPSSDAIEPASSPAERRVLPSKVALATTKKDSRSDSSSTAAAESLPSPVTPSANVLNSSPPARSSAAVANSSPTVRRGVS
jgi:hypothetical protein